MRWVRLVVEGITIRSDGKEIKGCSSAILVPEAALVEHGYIRTMIAGEEAGAKHEFHAMAQMAYYQFQDDELEVVEVAGDLEVSRGGLVEHVRRGMVVARGGEGQFFILTHPGLNTKKMLEAANRYCTRWVRLDI